MNMNKALQNLYHAVSGETTTKVNISKLLVDIHYAITGKESPNKNNWSKIVNSMADNWPEGGGGSSDFSTAEVTVANNSSGTIDIVGLPIGTTDEGMSMTVAVLPRLEMGTSAQVKVPLYQGACLWLTAYFDEYYRSVSFTAIGSATVSEMGVTITGDCTITIS